MKHAIVLVALLMLSTLSWGRDKKLVNVKVEVVSDEGMQGTVQGGGAIGAAVDAPDPDLWIHYIRPIDHVDIREHWKVNGSW